MRRLLVAERPDPLRHAVDDAGVVREQLQQAADLRRGQLAEEAELLGRRAGIEHRVDLLRRSGPRRRAAGRCASAAPPAARRRPRARSRRGPGSRRRRSRGTRPCSRRRRRRRRGSRSGPPGARDRRGRSAPRSSCRAGTRPRSWSLPPAISRVERTSTPARIRASAAAAIQRPRPGSRSSSLAAAIGPDHRDPGPAAARVRRRTGTLSPPCSTKRRLSAVLIRIAVRIRPSDREAAADHERGLEAVGQRRRQGRRRRRRPSPSRRRSGRWRSSPGPRARARRRPAGRR